MTTHRMSGTPTYKTWLKMRERCSNPNADQWKWYGGRGIRVCERWGSFKNFLADMGARPPGMTIDRVDSTRGYEPSNCRWANRRTQIHNQTKTIKVILDGEEVPLTVACERLGVSATMVYQRIKKNGFTFEQALAPGHLRETKTDENLCEYARLRKSGWTHKKLAQHFGMSASSLEKWSADARKRGWL